MPRHATAAPGILPPTLVRAESEQAIVATLALLALCSLIPLWSTAILPLQDLPNHLLKVDILHRYLAGDAGVRATYALNLKPLANYSCYVVIFLLSPLIGLMAAAKVFVSAYLLALPLAGYMWLKTVNPRGLILALAVPALSYSLFLTKGNLNFCAALPIYLFALVAFVRSRSRPWPSLAFTILATALYFTHGFVFLALCFTVGCMVASEPSRAALGRATGIVPGLILFAVNSAWAMIAARSAVAFKPSFTGFGGWSVITNPILWLFGGRGLGYDTAFAAVWVIVIAGLAARVAVEVASSWKTGPVELVRRYPIFAASVGLGLLYLLAPTNLSDWGHLRVRLIPIVCLTLLGALHFPSSRTMRAAIAVVFVTTALATQLRTAQTYAQGSAQVEEYLSGIGVVRPESSLLPIYAPTSETVRYNLHSWAYYEIAKGGWSGYLQAYPAYHPVVYRQVPWAPAEDLGGAGITDENLRRAANCYDYVLVWAPTPAQDQIVDRYFEPVYRSAHLHIWQSRRPLWHGSPSLNPACLTTPAEEHRQHA